ncbi:MAG TPA: SH3 domain-containing protein [Verrucomicrobiae bacterium]|nr:SH3 domain-containing protein [Verrucomicrobiae bacterium]
MKAGILALAVFLGAASYARAGTPAYVQCGTYDSYLLIYRSIDTFEELGKLRCNEKVEVLSHVAGYYQIQVADGRVGWVLNGDISVTPPPPHHTFTFGMTEPSKPPAPAPAPPSAAPSGTLTNEDVLALRNNPAGLAALTDKIKSSPCDFDTSPLAIRRLRSAGVPDKVILAMLAAPVASSEKASEQTAALTIPEDTSVGLTLTRDVPAGGLIVGEVVDLTATEDLVVHGVLIVQRGAQARARVLGVREPGPFSPGQVAWFLQDISTAEGGRVPAVFAARQSGKLHAKLLDGYAFFLSEFDKGHPAIRAEHSSIRALIVPGIVLEVPPSASAGLTAVQTKEPAQAPAANSPKAAAADPPPSAPPAEAFTAAEAKP